MRKLVLVTFIFCVTIINAQNSITFKVENKKKPDFLLDTLKMETIASGMVDSLVAFSEFDNFLVSYGTHSFLNGMHSAYAEHRPFVISPDMIWLLICQGFANHVNFNSSQLQNLFVDFNEKKILSVEGESLNGKNANTLWGNAIPKFTEQISLHIDKELISNLTANFSTSTSRDIIASQITIMETFEPYFEYEYIRMICGIPEITLKGTPEDWENIITKTKLLSKYELKWWTSKLIPILEKIHKTSLNKINRKFWQNMFKIHTEKVYGNPKNIDGWIINFFPYDKNGNRINLEEIKGIEMKDIFEILPNEIVNVKIKYREVYSKDSINEYQMALWAGFVGLKQNNVSLALEPQIGWFVSREFENDNNLPSPIEKIVYHQVIQFPVELLKLKHICDLTINFIDSIQIPSEISKINIDRLSLNGKIEKADIERIKVLLPGTVIEINHKKR